MRLISTFQLEVGMTVAGNIYAAKDSFMPIVTKDTVLTDRIIERIRKHQVDNVPIYDEDLPPLPARKAAPPPIPVIERDPPIITEELKSEALESIENLFSLFNPQEQEKNLTSAYQVVKELDDVVEHMVDMLESNSKALINIADLKSYDEYTYHHSLSVSVLSIAIGQSLGFSNTQLNHVGRCAILHDIGKTAIPIEIINKPSRLSELEFSQIKGHPEQGYSHLVDNRIANEEICRAVLYHHEKLDGTGYPHGLKGHAIPLMSRIISIADVYDALTSYRPYRTPMRPSEAVEYIMGNVGTSFDFDMVKAFLPKLDLYPVGAMVELSSGEIAIVLNNINTMRPIVQLLDTGETIDLFLDRNHLNLTIKNVLADDPPSHGASDKLVSSS